MEAEKDSVAAELSSLRSLFADRQSQWLVERAELKRYLEETERKELLLRVCPGMALFHIAAANILMSLCLCLWLWFSISPSLHCHPQAELEAQQAESQAADRAATGYRVTMQTIVDELRETRQTDEAAPGLVTVHHSPSICLPLLQVEAAGYAGGTSRCQKQLEDVPSTLCNCKAFPEFNSWNASHPSNHLLSQRGTQGALRLLNATLRSWAHGGPQTKHAAMVGDDAAGAKEGGGAMRSHVSPVQRPVAALTSKPRRGIFTVERRHYSANVAGTAPSSPACTCFNKL